ncbi:hypothetical protein [Xanthomonas vasicola]|uniref:hypothetical protein n=1 Tax=Xanthomonas vasicola TaxID=56459 RepID=UPI0013C35759|nr:hypothetical protein [Xanthomonas vasicola]HHZ33938.1 hypothetical protein [Xanthomonas vasicola pv. zeae]HHZ37749.1 hypothetical protein [Xanthomonas vasicola pv. zeae]HHZ42039.1 hypothetical protein [Xanthomonas vasicola pv. zeae]HHZ58350.1 hypothetical protein [Xanthomonas vasicola pv. zeae]
MKPRDARLFFGRDVQGLRARRDAWWRAIGGLGFVRPSGYRQLAIGNWQLAIGNWQLAIGYWLLAIGYWLLAIGYWLLASQCDGAVAEPYRRCVQASPLLFRLQNACTPPMSRKR